MEQRNLNKALMDCITNPAKCRLFIEIAKQGEVTAKSLAETCADIPQTTLYRHLKRMTEDGLLKIVSETPVRGTVERTYALALDPADPLAMLGEISGARYMQMFFQYFLVFARLFQEYCDTPGIDIERDRSGMTLSPLYLTDEELEKAVTEVARIFSSLQENQPAPGRKLRTVGLIVSPAHPAQE